MLGPIGPPTPCEVLLATIRACTVRAICSALKRAEPDSRGGEEEEEGGRRGGEGQICNGGGREGGKGRGDEKRRKSAKKGGGKEYNKQTQELVQVISWRNFGTIRSEVTTHR